MNRKDWRNNKERKENYRLFFLQALFGFADDSNGRSDIDLMEVCKKVKVPTKELYTWSKSWSFWEPSNLNWRIGRVIYLSRLNNAIMKHGGESMMPPDEEWVGAEAPQMAATIIPDSIWGNSEPSAG